jgi:hypothetical protein
MIKKFFTNDIYIKVSEDRFEAKNISTNGEWESVNSPTPFSTERLLVGTFSNAEPVLRKLVKNILPKGLIRMRPKVVIHPLSRVEGGLSEIENRVFEELAGGAGALVVVIHVGDALSDEEVSNLLSDA